MVSQPRSMGPRMSDSMLSPIITAFSIGPVMDSSCSFAKLNEFGCGLPQIQILRSCPQTSLYTVLRLQVKGFINRRGKLCPEGTWNRSLQQVITGMCFDWYSKKLFEETLPCYVLRTSMMIWIACYQWIGVVRTTTPPIFNSCLSRLYKFNLFLTFSLIFERVSSSLCSAMGTLSVKIAQYS